ncbi:GH36-type glycosyl hydrolase domain-containing protein [Phenylobacterium sp.]|uniref:GH36-type glycosyl hydrolase domain-containing protein n=1 Tax=Phenylobacterium sp. TaxID=1871053 RepID=UPI0027309C80|nr:glucoamylase family protein [Phenylobacterium sp.]MDP1873109.1 glucoamylase family protein [Phenylobacterium sp.]
MTSIVRRMFGQPAPLWMDDEPIRAELFSVERLEDHAASLARAQPIVPGFARGRPLSRRLAENEVALVAAYRDIAGTVAQGAAITPAAEWLVDNFHIVEKQIREIRLDLPVEYYKELPKLATGPFAGYPRVFSIAWAFVAHTDSHFDKEMLCRFLTSYQRVQPLTIGELWAVAITLRIVLVENLRRIAERVVDSRQSREEADRCADRLLGVAGEAPQPTQKVLAAFERGALRDAFVVQLVMRLRDQDAAAAAALTWLDGRMSQQGGSADAAVRDEQQRQVSASVTVRNIVTSMRLISDVDWSELFERCSLVDASLSNASAFADMDFPTRNLYRDAIEDLARGSDLSEIDVALRALQVARAATHDVQADARRADPGYHLLGGGRPDMEKALGYRPELWRRPARFIRSFGISGYVVVGGMVALLLLAIPLFLLASIGLGGWALALLTLLGAVPAIDVAVALVNRGLTQGVRARPLPALELRSGAPSRLRTLVAVPVLLTSHDLVEELIERLEIHYLASSEGHLHFALLSDWADSASVDLEGDEALLLAAREGIAKLNTKYGPAPGGDRFLLLHRRRVWSKSEQRWMGWERKRGKLHELNRLLRGARDTTFLGVNGHPPVVPLGVKYVITLDADTRLPRDTVRRLIGKMAHPLNQPRFDPNLGRVVEGYAILQPRVSPDLPAAGKVTPFLRAFSSMSGIDPYASAVSDVYQDLFGEGSYAGKGIYEIDSFEAALQGRVPEAALLSHDLFEGIFARAGLASDVEVIEEFPARYDAAAMRHHRWARGDWQLLPWIIGRGPPGSANAGHRAIPAIGRWKMLDNLRRSMSAPSAFAALVAGWTLPAGAASIWTLFILATIVLPTLAPIFTLAPPRIVGISPRRRLRALAGDLRRALIQSALILTLLAHQAALMADAIGRTLWRLYVTRRRLLEWSPAAQAAHLRQSPGAYGHRMASAIVLAGVALILALASGHGTVFLAAPLVLLWAASPRLAFAISRPQKLAEGLSAVGGDGPGLRQIARRTWRFFETFVTAEDHMLPPDNFQDNPAAALARRTSPTNIGLYLLSVATARQFGWIGLHEAVQRLEATFETLAELPRYRGHFYNWYDTGDLRPLEPKYVSSVDSGNLAGHLIALANICRQWTSLNPSDSVRLAGIADAFALTREALQSLRAPGDRQTVVWRQLEEASEGLVNSTRAIAPETSLLEVLADLGGRTEALTQQAHALAVEHDAAVDLVFWSEAAARTIADHQRDLAATTEASEALHLRLAHLEQTARDIAVGMEFGFLLDPDRMLLSIGYRTAEGELDPSCYDLLGSEARLASFFAIAKGDVPAKHWFRLGRAVTPAAKGAALISWSGSMFEYLMPSLIMRAAGGSLLEQTNQLIVQEQIAYGEQLGIPWGISESAYNARDLEFTYQYLNFGVPTLGLKRGLATHSVVAPYATALAAMVHPSAAARNFERLTSLGALGRYGFYEAVDFTRSRVPTDDDFAIVGTFMAHHQGMTIVALGEALLGGPMQANFHAEPMVQASELLLQERMPRDVPERARWAAEAAPTSPVLELEVLAGRRVLGPYGAAPATHLLSNGRYSVMMSAAGSGYSRWRGVALTRWREDATCDDWGSYVFLRDVKTGHVWSTAAQPCGQAADAYHAVFSEDRCEFERLDGSLKTTMEVLISGEDDAEVRRVSICNLSSLWREVEVTSYSELALAPQAADIAHPAFSKLFVETEYLAGPSAVLATRRRRSRDEPEVWAAHLSLVEGEAVGRTEFETDRARFIGRGRDIQRPVALDAGRPLAGSTGFVLDPIFSLRRRVRIAPGATARVTFWTMAASSRKAIIDLVDKHQDSAAFNRAAALAWTQALVHLHHLGVDRGEANLFQRLASHLIYASPALRPPSEQILEGRAGQPELWRLGISGDLPIMLLRIDSLDNLSVARQSLRAFQYWRTKQFACDLVILNEHGSSYVQDLQIALESLVRASQSRAQTGDEATAGRVVILRSDMLAPEMSALLMSVSRVVFFARTGSLADQIERASEDRSLLERPARPSLATTDALPALVMPQLELFNGLGGFAKDGQEYVTVLRPGVSTPAPWINVIANPRFGFQVSAEGAGYTWSANSRERQLTPWSNDPIANPAGEVFYLRDDDTGDVWSPTATPIRDETSTYVARHGHGYSQFDLETHGVATELLQFVPATDPVKVTRLRLHNRSNRARRLTVTAYVEWTLGSARTMAAPHTATEFDEASGAIFARNAWAPAFADKVAFIGMEGQTGWTADRREFIGRNGSLAAPAALAKGTALSGRVGAGLDPCAALQTTIELSPGESRDVVVLLGDADSAHAARDLIGTYRAAEVDAVLSEAVAVWDDLLTTVQVKTPDRPLDLMLNGWLLYQTLACRIWARSAFYQASGAYGFRDQLQDGMALAALRPELTREHLLRAAARQFIEGDVQHWWLPHSGQGVRTRISDDRIWLAFTAAHYLLTTEDVSLLDEPVTFVEGARLEPGEAENFFLPGTSVETASFYEHCARALDQSMELGGHGLPLIGGGDWNDGMNRVGERGLGESVWLGWFLYRTINDFAPVAESRGDDARAAIWRAHAASLLKATEREAWDGDWYRRGWFDDGTPLGSASREECRIDQIAQSWAVLSGGAMRDRAVQAMEAVDRELILDEPPMALLFTPPFDHTPLDPGYIKAYPPGVRENGGQYTHAAAWAVMAYAELGDGDRAADLFAKLNPINHARTRAEANLYKVEPYVAAADVYAAPGHVGRGGWTWYTGSAGWLHRAGLESILGLRRAGAILKIDPCIPGSWPFFEVSVRHGAARYEIRVENPAGVCRGVVAAELDGVPIELPVRLSLTDDGLSHSLRLVLGEQDSTSSIGAAGKKRVPS